MGSHLFKVDELCLNIDKDFMQEVCERVGFIPDPSIWNPPDDYIDFPPIDELDEKVQLLYAIEADFEIDFQMNAGTFRMVVFGDNETIVHDENITVATRFQRILNYLDGKIASDGMSTLRVEFQAIASPILSFRLYGDKNAIQAYINTPNLVNMWYSFSSNKDLKNYEYFSPMPNIDNQLELTFSRAKNVIVHKIPDVPNAKKFNQNLRGSYALQKVVWLGKQYDELENVDYMLSENSTKAINPINQFSFLESYPKLYSFRECCRAMVNLKKLILPKYVDDSREINFWGLLQDCVNIEYVEYPVNMLSANIRDLYRDCSLIKKTYLPEDVPMWGSGIFYNAVSIEKVKFLHNETIQYAPTNMCRGMTAVEEIEIIGDEALWTDMSYMFYNDENLKSLKLPASLPVVTTIANMTAGCQLLTELHPIQWTITPIRAENSFTTAMYVVNQPTLRVTHFALNSVTAKNTTHINIDWANSNFSTLTSSINISGVQLDVIEIDRIFTELPAVSNNRNINVRLNPGAAACDATIATAKGWTVTK